MIESVELTVTGMKCGGCENIVKTKLSAVNGVQTVSASSKDKRVTIEFDADKTQLAQLKQTIQAAGYTVSE